MEKQLNTATKHYYEKWWNSRYCSWCTVNSRPNTRVFPLADHAHPIGQSWAVNHTETGNTHEFTRPSTEVKWRWSQNIQVKLLVWPVCLMCFPVIYIGNVFKKTSSIQKRYDDLTIALSRVCVPEMWYQNSHWPFPQAAIFDFTASFILLGQFVSLWKCPYPSPQFMPQESEMCHDVCECVHASWQKGSVAVTRANN